MPPREVRALRPTEVASILGLDRELAVVAAARPLLDGEFVDLQTDTVPENLWTPPSSGQNREAPSGQRLRRTF